MKIKTNRTVDGKCLQVNTVEATNRTPGGCAYRAEVPGSDTILWFEGPGAEREFYVDVLMSRREARAVRDALSAFLDDAVSAPNYEVTEVKARRE